MGDYILTTSRRNGRPVWQCLSGGGGGGLPPRFLFAAYTQEFGWMWLTGFKLGRFGSNAWALDQLGVRMQRGAMQATALPPCTEGTAVAWSIYRGQTHAAALQLRVQCMGPTVPTGAPTAAPTPVPTAKDEDDWMGNNLSVAGIPGMYVGSICAGFLLLCCSLSLIRVHRMSKTHREELQKLRGASDRGR